jgi:hypothetical protein
MNTTATVGVAQELPVRAFVVVVGGRRKFSRRCVVSVQQIRRDVDIGQLLQPQDCQKI